MSSTDTTNAGLVAIAVVIYVVIALAVYVWVALALSRVFVKLGVPAWKGWVPFVNIVTVYRLGGFSPLWLITLFFPVVQLAGVVVYYFAAHAINRRFGKTAAWTVLAVLVFPVWATVLGFGSSRPVGAVDPDAASPFESRMVGLAPGTSPAPTPAAVVPPVSVEPVAPPVVPTPASPSISPATPSISPASEENPWAPPISSIPGLTPPPVSAAAPPVPAPLSADPPAPVIAEQPDTDKTVIRRRGPVFLLEPAGGEPIVLTGTVVLLGRNPRADAADLTAQLIALLDPSKTVSKTHARLALVDGEWEITDLVSTNGTIVVDRAGTEVELESGASASVTGWFRLGQLAVTIRQDG